MVSRKWVFTKAAIVIIFMVSRKWVFTKVAIVIILMISRKSMVNSCSHRYHKGYRK
jgi:hypothetical protein